MKHDTSRYSTKLQKLLLKFLVDAKRATVDNCFSQIWPCH